MGIGNTLVCLFGCFITDNTFFLMGYKFRILGYVFWLFVYWGRVCLVGGVCCVTENAPQKPGGPLAWFRVKAYLLTVIRPSVQLPKLQWKPPYRLKTGSFCCRFNNNTNLSWHFHVPALQVQMSCCTSLLICIEHVSPLQTSIYAA